ncbi:site-specific integrase [Bifidobacterium oedipodis]|uniref:Site-specific recombinase, phage integrase family n=1 Tax=Bifidobacterium oedipodis TaxID=2675322 RepID=A0A7Y0HT86_9BIFI|nr:site-specific integrase [Bifidobacterium sp. DSM 109957]NMM93857.1 site-specific recombinase, phage integrase family [Bifidobacterium sp. DSM 109957]
MLRKAHRWGLCQRDITGMVHAPKQPRHEPPILTNEQIRTLLQGFWGHELEAWLICALTLGLRREEGMGLEWEDIDLRSGKVRIRRALQWVNGHESLVPPKTELSRRTLILPRFAVQRLRQIKGKGRLIGALTPEMAARRYESWCKRHDLPYVPPMNLRTSWATSSLAAGVDVAVVSRMMGHSSITTTARYYLRPELDVLRQAQRQWEKTIIR